MLSKLAAVVGISALVVVFAVGFFPGLYSSGFNNYGSMSPSTCTTGYTDNLPSGNYAPGATVSGTVTVNCNGSGSWGITGPGCTSSPSLCSGTFSCSTAPCTITLFTYTAGSAPLTKGTYLLIVTYMGVANNYGFTVGGPFTVTPEFPVGALLAVLAPIAAVFGYLKFRKPSLSV